MYRAIALEALRAGADASREEAMLELAAARPIRVEPDGALDRGFRVYAGPDELGEELYGNDVSRVVSAVSAHPAIRALMVERQRAIAAAGPVVMAGRDIGTVVLPDAPVKVYLTASADARVERRLAEMAERGSTVSAGELRVQIAERDRLDENRAVAPLRAAPDAVLIDSSDLSVAQVVDLIAALVARGEPG
jgi:cytidylate kinase